MFKRSERSESDAREITSSITTNVDRSLQEPRVHATIGSTIHIKGDVSGDENLTIDGTVEGTVTVKQHSIQVGKNGRLLADVRAKVIRVEGHVDGNLHADEQVVIRASGVVRGNVVSPRLTMEDGCSFKGSVDMEGRSDRKPAADKAAAGAVDDASKPGRIAAAG
jgi:cytoskeletal protein CcmA (bactofilin family)